jgi:hypothetical protein
LTSVTTGKFRNVAISGPTHSVLPSLLAMPQNITSTEPIFSMPLASA